MMTPDGKTRLTKEQLLEEMASLLDMPCTFETYYKYEFLYRINDKVTFSVGGDSDDIYRATLTPTSTMRKVLHEVGLSYAHISIDSVYYELDRYDNYDDVSALVWEKD